MFPQIFFCIGTVIFILAYSKMDITKVMKWNGVQRTELFKIILSAIFLSLAMILLASNTAIGKVMNFEIPELFTRGTLSSGLGYFFLFALLPAFGEELLFRGIIFNGFRKQYNFLTSAIISSLFFAIVHFSVFKSAHTFIAGLFLALLYERNGLIACFFFHLIFNSTALALGMTSWGGHLMNDLGPFYIPFAMFFGVTSVILHIRLRPEIEAVPESSSS